MKYFAYGSNLNPDRLIQRNVIFSSREFATLKGYRLVFNKKADGGNFVYANIESSTNDLVEGAIYELDDADLTQLDRFEGYPKHYQRISVDVSNAAGELISAVAYIAHENKIVHGLYPTREYLDHILAGEDIVSDEYFEFLSQTVTVD